MATLLKNLGYAKTVRNAPSESDFAIEDASFSITPLEPPKSYQIQWANKEWRLDTKVVLDDATLRQVCCLAARFAPPGSTVHLQADTHGAGNVFVGMIMSVDTHAIPIHLISGDIGCGLSVVPVVREGHLKTGALDESYVLATMRRSLKRGQAAEKGSYLSSHIHKALAFYGFSELPHWLNEMRYVLDTVGVTYDSYKEDAETEGQVYDGLTYEQSVLLRYIGRFAQSLGSSGNHFMELSEDEQGYLWLTVHSGSRGLGAMVYQPIADACRILSADYQMPSAEWRGPPKPTKPAYEIATGALAVFYARAYDALNKFAKLNRLLCAIAVLANLGCETDGEALRDWMSRSFLFAPAMDAVGQDAECMLSLMSGLTHNGIKAFINHDIKQVLYVLSKGAIAMTKRASASIVALRAGDGCYVWTLADPSCPWVETDIQTALSLGYEVVHESADVIYSGHGAGRARGTNKTAAMSTFEDVVAFYEETGFVGNVAPGLLGDNPRIAYNDVPTIVKHLPLEIACTKSQLKTRVAYKEGISYNKSAMVACAAYIDAQWDTASEAKKLWLDFGVCRQFLPPGRYEVLEAERVAILERLDAAYGGHFKDVTGETKA